MKIALMPNLSKQNAHTYTVRIIKRLLELQCEIFLYAKYRDYFDIQAIHFIEDFSDMVRECDAVITMRGDGTIIHAAKHAAAAAKPILGINLGRIGFVAGLEIDELDKLKYLISGDYKVENRMLLKVTVHTATGEREIYALNERSGIERLSFQNGGSQRFLHGQQGHAVPGGWTDRFYPHWFHRLFFIRRWSGD